MRLIIPAAAKNQKDDQTKQNSKWEPTATKFMKNPAPRGWNRFITMYTDDDHCYRAPDFS